MSGSLAAVAASQVIFYFVLGAYLRWWHGSPWVFALLALPVSFVNTGLFYYGYRAVGDGGAWAAQAVVWLCAVLLPIVALSVGTGHPPNARAMAAIGLCVAGVAVAAWPG